MPPAIIVAAPTSRKVVPEAPVSASSPPLACCFGWPGVLTICSLPSPGCSMGAVPSLSVPVPVPSSLPPVLPPEPLPPVLPEPPESPEPPVWPLLWPPDWLPPVCEPPVWEPPVCEPD
ncbi:hypothetical protein SRIMM317S_01696 [Streptomyces rimosus subsp. rimosus]